MAVFPMFIDLKGKKCVVVGGGKVATRKVATLIAFNADIIVISPKITKIIEDLNNAGKLSYRKKYFSEDDLDGAFMVIAATSDNDVNESVYNEAVAKGIFVNVADNPERCTFIFPSVVKRDELVVGISSSGSYPMLSKAVREKLDGMLTKRLDGELIQVLREYRQKALIHIQDEEQRKQFLKRLLDEIVFHDEMLDIELLHSKIDRLFGEYGHE